MIVAKSFNSAMRRFVKGAEIAEAEVAAAIAPLDLGHLRSRGFLVDQPHAPQPAPSRTPAVVGKNSD